VVCDRTYRHVVIVDPDPSALAQMMRALRAAGYQTTAALTFEEARQQIQMDPPDLLLAHARLGRYNGLHLALAAERRDMKTIITSALADPALEREVVGFGAAFLVKPIPEESLVAVVTSLVGAPRVMATPVTATVAPLFVSDRRKKTDRRRLVILDFPNDRRVRERRRLD
jgi:DNA-binding response OmpR family regulator